MLEQRQVVAAGIAEFFVWGSRPDSKGHGIKMIRTIIAVCLVTTFPMVLVGQEKAIESDPLAQYRVEATEKWEAEIAKLEAQDRSQPDPKDAILFIGSSSIRRWTDLGADMSPRSTINRGYGGAKFSDLAVYVDRIVNPHEFKALVIFVGNDIVGKPNDKTPAEVARLFKYIVGQVRKSHATQPIFLIAITPTPSRFTAWPEIRQANAELAKACESQESLYFISTEKHYLDESGKPLEKYFVEDQLHQNREGYRVWSRIVNEHLERVLGAAQP
jgi:lysophospholipase L1-like esterase